MKNSAKSWGKEIDFLKRFFKNKVLLPFRLNKCEVVLDPQKFLDAHFSILEKNNGKFHFRIYLYRLIQYYEILSNSKGSFRLVLEASNGNAAKDGG